MKRRRSCHMFKAICVIVIVVFIGLMVFSITNAIRVSKRNKVADEIHRRTFMSQIEKEKDERENGSKEKKQNPKAVIKTTAFEPEKPKV